MSEGGASAPPREKKLGPADRFLITNAVGEQWVLYAFVLYTKLVPGDLDGESCENYADQPARSTGRTRRQIARRFAAEAASGPDV